MNDRSHLMCCKVDCGAFLIDNGVLLVDYRALLMDDGERWGAGVETQKNVRGEFGGWGRVPFNEPYAPSLSTIYDGV